MSAQGELVSHSSHYRSAVLLLVVVSEKRTRKREKRKKCLIGCYRVCSIGERPNAFPCMFLSLDPLTMCMLCASSYSKSETMPASPNSMHVLFFTHFKLCVCVVRSYKHPASDCGALHGYYVAFAAVRTLGGGRVFRSQSCGL